jgi:hypothetical protein
MYHHLWWYGLMFLFMILCPDQFQFCQNICLIFAGFGVKETQNWELNRKRKVLIFTFKRRKRVRKGRFKFKRPSIPPKTKRYHSPIQKAVDLLSEKWKKKQKEVSSVYEGALKAFIATHMGQRGYNASDSYQYDNNDNSGSLVPTTGAIFKARTNEMPIVFDTGCSMSVSPLRQDFIGELEESPTDSLQGLKSKVKVVGIGRVIWTIFDLNGITRTIKTRAYFIPEGNIRLFSPQTYFQENEKGSSKITARGIEADGTVLTFPYNQQSNIPLMLTKEHSTVGLTYSNVEFLAELYNVSSYLSVAAEVNQNITAAQKELLCWHWRLGHAGFQWIQWLMAVPRDRPEGNEEPIIQAKHPKASSCPLLLCVACQIAKQTRLGDETIRQMKVDEKEQMLRRGHLEPGQMVSVHQYVSALPGRLPHTKGKEPKQDKYCGGTTFLDHASTKIFIKNQVSLNAGETVMAKKAFEREAMSSGVRIRGYHANNVPFNSEAWRLDIESKGQELSLSGTGARHQNGVAERAISIMGESYFVACCPSLARAG